MSVESFGELDFETDANDMNVPVNIFIDMSDQFADEHPGKWELHAANYMPRKERAHQSAYQYAADSRQELVELVRKYVVPLYEVALAELKEFGTLYYWESSKTLEVVQS